MKRAVYLFIATFLMFFACVSCVNAQDKVIETDTPLGAEMPATPSSEIIAKSVNYELAYPGMLPDNPFYILKALRDGVVKLLINDPFKRAKFSLLNSDKRIFAGKLLLDKGKDALALETIEKSNNYLDDAIVAIRVVKKQNPKSADTEPFLQQLKTAVKKHQEVMEDMTPFIDTKMTVRFSSQKNRLGDIKKTVDALLTKK